MKPLLRRLAAPIIDWWQCRTQRCDYFTHYLAWGPPDMPHTTYHAVERRALEHFSTCRYDATEWDGTPKLCPTCLRYEKQVRA